MPSPPTPPHQQSCALFVISLPGLLQDPCTVPMVSVGRPSVQVYPCLFFCLCIDRVFIQCSVRYFCMLHSCFCLLRSSNFYASIRPLHPSSRLRCRSRKSQFSLGRFIRCLCELGWFLCRCLTMCSPDVCPVLAHQFTSFIRSAYALTAGGTMLLEIRSALLCYSLLACALRR